MLSAGGRAVKMRQDDQRYRAFPDDYIAPASSVETPVLFMTRRTNHVFTDSNILCHQALEQMVAGQHQLVIFLSYGYQDVFMSNRVHEDIFPTFLAFLTAHRAAPA